MAVTTVFDVADALLERAPGHRLETLKLQKLCFYVFGWYAHQTGVALFDERFYAMPKGPVVGELLSAHAGKAAFSQEQLGKQFDEHDLDRDGLDLYVDEIVDAVWRCYGKLSAGELVDLTHEEQVWIDAWEHRPEGARRGDLSQEEIVGYFLHRRFTSFEEGRLDLPDSQITFVDADWLSELDSRDDLISEEFIANVVAALRGERSD